MVSNNILCTTRKSYSDDKYNPVRLSQNVLHNKALCVRVTYQTDDVVNADTLPQPRDHSRSSISSVLVGESLSEEVGVTLTMTGILWLSLCGVGGVSSTAGGGSVGTTSTSMLVPGEN